MRRLLASLAVLAAVLGTLFTPTTASACSSILVSKGATTDGAPMTTYVADSHELFGDLRLTPAAVYPEGTTLDIIEWDTGKKLGTIAQARRTYAVVGNLNEKQVAIAESTFTGREDLRDPTATIDYGTLMQLALQRAASAKEAVTVMTSLVAEYGYASTGESFSISDPNEAWLLEMIGKGPGNKGALWVARRVPDGMLTAHANVSRIHTFPLNDKDTLYAKDVITFAREKGWFTGKDADFSFSDAYAPLTWEDLRFCEARVWSVFRRAAPSLKLAFDADKGAASRMPLWVKPDKKLTVADVMALMRDHFEGTPYDMTKGVGAGPYHAPYRWRPLTWDSGDKHYLNERAISTQQTGFSFISQSRAALPDLVGGLLWFGVDDTFSTVWVPLYAALTQAPPSFAAGKADLLHYSPDSAFWVFNQVAQHVYARYSEEIVDLQTVQRQLEGTFLARQAAVEQAAVEKFKRSPEEARAYLAAYSTEQAEATVKRWRTLGEDLLVKYLDGNLKDELGHVKHPGYPADFNALVAKVDGAQLEVKHLASEPRAFKPVPVTGYFHSREELGAFATAVPKDFDFTTSKLLLVPGSDQCQRPPRCCATAHADGDSLVVDPPKEEAKDPCGSPAWLLKLPVAEHRKVVLPADE
jgi:dipeptidase